jgi:hypothetical protein
MQKALSVLSPYLGDTHLEYGCGAGWLSFMIALSGVDVIGYDKKKHPLFPPKINFVSSLEGMYDSISFPFVLHETGFSIFEEVKPYLNPGGHVCILDYNLKHVSLDEFMYAFDAEAERNEIFSLGYDNCYNLHTRYGLDDCIKALYDSDYILKEKEIINDKFFLAIAQISTTHS